MRRTVSVISVILLLLGGFMLSISFDLTSQDASAEDWYMSIDVDTTWNTDKTIKTDIYISAGKTLTIYPGVKVLFDGAFSFIVNSTGKLVANGGQTQPIIFDRIGGSKWAGLKVLNNARSEFDWCTFSNATDGIILQNNQFQTNITNCSFSNCVEYLNITTSKVNVTSTKFEGKAFDKNPTQILGKINEDATSEIYIQYFVNIFTVNGSSDLTTRPRVTYPVSAVNVQINYGGGSIVGTTDFNGEFPSRRVTALKITGTAKARDYSYNNYTFTVTDKWDGTAKAFPGISNNNTVFNISFVVNQSTDDDALTVDGNLHIHKYFMFKYPPVIITAPNQVTIYEDIPKTCDFKFFDNDDQNIETNITINITDENGHSIYGSNTIDKWIYWDNTSGGQLHFLRTVESPFTPAGPQAYKAVVNENIWITIIDKLGNNAKKDMMVAFHNVPDKPAITGIPLTVSVTENLEKIIQITVSDNDNTTKEIYVTSDSEHVTYRYHNNTNQSLKLLFSTDFGEDGSQSLVNITATDNCSEAVKYSFNVFFEKILDTPEKIILENPYNNSYLNDPAPELKWNEGKDRNNDPLTYIVQVADFYRDWKTPILNKHTAVGVLNWEITTPLKDGKYKWRVCANDGSGNGTWSDVWEFTLDTTPPRSEIVIPVNNKYYNNLEIINGLASDSLNCSGIKRVEITIQELSNNYFWDGSLWLPNEIWLSVSGTNSWSFEFNPYNWITDTLYNIRSRAIDNISNLEIPNPGVTFMFDNKPPECSISINNDEKYTNSTSVTLSLYVNDSGSGVSHVAYSINGNVWSQWEGINITKTFELSGDDGEKTVYFIVKDHAYNSAIVHDTIILDSTPPHSISISINDSVLETTSSELTLNLHALDNLSGVSQMSFSIDGQLWTPWKSYYNNKSFTLPSYDGVYTIHFKVKDRAGNIADPTWVQIILNTSSPETYAFPDLEPEKEETNKTSTTFEYWYLIVVVVIIAVMVILIMLVIKRRKKPIIEPPLTSPVLNAQPQARSQPQQPAPIIVVTPETPPIE